MSKILIVEDEAVTAMELEETLSRRGYEVVGTAANGPDALRIAKERWPDLILMDIRLQGPMDGIETADQINLFYEIPVIFLTAYSDDLTPVVPQGDLDDMEGDRISFRGISGHFADEDVTG